VRPGIEAIRADPELGDQLTRELSGLRGLRVGRLRIVYRVEPRQIQVVAIGPRATIYQELSVQKRGSPDEQALERPLGLARPSDWRSSASPCCIANTARLCDVRYSFDRFRRATPVLRHSACVARGQQSYWELRIEPRRLRG